MTLKLLLLLLLVSPCLAQSGNAWFSGSANAYPIKGTNTVPGLIYYVSTSAGSDSNNGLSPSTPWKTIAKVNSMVLFFQPLDQVLFHRGEVFPGMIKISNLSTATTAATNYTTNPMPAANITIGAYGTPAALSPITQLPTNDPIIDGADAVSLTWTQVSGNLYSAPWNASWCPVKLYDQEAEETQYQPVYNYIGNFDSSGSTTYQCWDEVYSTVTSRYYGNASGLPTNSDVQVYNLWASVYPGTTLASGLTQTTTPTTAQLTQDGITNASQCTINCFYLSAANQTLYVYHAAGGPPPSTMYASNPARPYGVLLQGTTGVGINHIRFAHHTKACVKSLAYGYTSHGYVAGQNQNWHHIDCDNYGDQTNADRIAVQGGVDATSGGLIMSSNLTETYPQLAINNTIQNTYLGQSDAYSVRGAVMYMQDGTQTIAGVTTNRSVFGNIICRNASICLHYYGQPGYYTSATQPAPATPAIVNWNSTSHLFAVLSKGGMVNNVVSTGFHAGNIFFGTVSGGEITHFVAKHGKGEGVQLGGGSLSVDGGGWAQQTVDTGACLHLGASDTGNGYNCVDTNDGGGKFGDTYAVADGNSDHNPWGPITHGEHVEHITCIDAADGCITTEPGEAEAVVKNDALYQISDGSVPGTTAGGKPGAIYYAITHGVAIGNGPTYANNAIALVTAGDYIVTLDGSTGSSATCANMSSVWNTYNSKAPLDPTSKCDTSSSSPPWFNNLATDDFGISTTSFLATFLGNGDYAGALAPGQPIWATGPQPDPNISQ